MENQIHSAAADQNHPSLPSPPSKSKKPPGGWRAIKYILGNETFEKVASMSLISNLTVYLRTKYNMNGILLINVVSIWSGSSNVTSIAGALISDTFLGRFRTLLYGSIASFLGMGIMALTAGVRQLRPSSCVGPSQCPQPEIWQLATLLGGLALLAIGAGGIRPCNIAFGADQFDTSTKKGKVQLQSFFNWWYFSFTAALVVALTAVVYIQTNISWTLGFVIPTACFFISITVFVIGHHTYIIKKPQGSVFVDLAKVVVASCRKRGVSVKTTLEDSFYDPEISINHRTARFRCLEKAAVITNSGELNNQGKPVNGWTLCSIQQVEDLKLLVGMVPVWAAGILCFIAMDQQNTIGMLQAIQTDKTIRKFHIPPGWLGLVSMFTISIWIVIYERIYLPLSKKFTGKARRLTLKQRIRIGIVMAILCPLVAGVVEKKRRTTALRHGSFESPLSVLILGPQFALSGMIEAFTGVALMEFLTTQLPESMRTVSGAIFFLSLSMASYLNSVMVNIIHKITSKKGNTPWLGGNDLNKDRLEYFYFFIAGVGVCNFLYFYLFASRYVLPDHNNNDLDKNGNENDDKKQEGA